MSNQPPRKMSDAKARRREIKLKNQPANVQYPVSEDRSHFTGNGGQTQKGAGSRHGWVRGHQKDGGYCKEMPKYINAGSFARARAAEVKAMVKAVRKKSASCHLFSALPKHMRRRAMSHNTKRLPRRLQEMATKLREKSLQGAKKKKQESKKKSRKARRRHGNLLLEFNRRQRKNIWLETHVWHAKRFHMVKKWGYCLGDRPTYKCYRPCYRAMSNHCLLQDLSYYCCIELLGEEDKLLAALSQLTSKDTGPSFAAGYCLSGRRQGSVVVYRARQYPSQPLGPVTFLWRPPEQGLNQRQLWIWAHPTLKQDLLTELQYVCECSEPVIPPVVPVALPAEVPSSEKTMELPNPSPVIKQMSGIKRKSSCSDKSGPPAKKIIGDGTRSPTTPVMWRSRTSTTVIHDLTMEIVRYRLIGPLSHTVLAETLEAATSCKNVDSSVQSSLWWPEHCKDEAMMNLHKEQSEIFGLLKGVYSTGEIPPGTVLGLNVDDPRVTLPTKKVKALPSIKQGQEVDEKVKQLILNGVSERCCQSFLWDRTIRNNVTENKIPEQELNRMKSDMLVPGSRLQPMTLQGRVPVLLVHQPGKQVGHEMNTWGAGWDILLPKGWGMAFWVPLVYRGVRQGGLHMTLKHSQNKSSPNFPHDYPDCPAGIKFQEEQEAELLDKFKRHPPAKRTNYIKLGCLAPFRCPWKQLAEEWEVISAEESKETKESTDTDTVMEEGATLHQDVTSTTPQRLTVLRNRKSLRLLSGWCRPTTSRGQRACRLAQPAPLNQSTVNSFLSAHGMSLVWVRLSLLSKGKPELHGMVCVPTLEDLKLLHDPQCTGPLEPAHKDHFKSKLKRPQKSKKATGTGQQVQVVTPISVESSSSTPNSVFGLWPDPLPSITSHCSRVTLGWITQGDFSLTAGCGEALGFVSVSGLLSTLLKQPMEHRGLLLLRNPTSLHYRFVKANIEV
ncbi:ribonucleases P/MRP protein subunit POP1 [Periophthalmus magnuspinnatus]|uniref:ribonucleases P/MRP protein subunit POP1 n=1 Tax=Periophthalmus magnuspinnatus TaxID=409849 RepID=UPI00145AB932|nr:ribonucleases P/MRP protein subunit POP1 [Periophthalmus magnuspinnatus]